MSLLVFFVSLNFILLLFAFVFLFYRQTNKKRADSILSEIRYQVNKLIGELDVVTDREVTLLENRVDEAKRVLKELEKRIAQLKTLAQDHAVIESLYDSLEAQEIQKRLSKSDRVPSKGKKEKSVAPLQEESPSIDSRQKRGKKKISTDSAMPDSKEFSELASKANASLSTREQVLLLKSKGVENKQIANQLKIAFDEVETILAMNFFIQKNSGKPGRYK